MLSVAVAAAAVRAVSGVGRVVPLLSGWHLDDLMRDTPEPPPSAIFVYSSSWCLSQWRAFGVDGGRGLPSRTHLFLGEYDMERWRDIWWQVEDEQSMRLERRFNVTRAPAVVFVPKNNDQSAFQVWDGGDVSWRDWLLEKLRFDLRVTNGLTTAVTVDEAPLLPGESRTIAANPGDLVGDVVAINSGAGCATLTIDAQPRTSTAAQDAHLNSRDQDTTFTHSANVRQPPVMPSHDLPSYEVIDMPTPLVDRLASFYERHASRRVVESYSPRSTGINQHVVNTTLVSFDLDARERDAIADDLVRPLVEAWVGMPLVHTSFYGIREYYRRHELRMHVDRVATHVFSVIINLHQEAVQEDWALDVIDFDGAWRSVLMKPNQLLFYQSAKLVHGRPKPFNGSRFVNCFVHFKPAHGWNYVYGAGDVLYFNGDKLLDYKVD